MTRLTRIVAAAAIICSLAVPAFAGDDLPADVKRLLPKAAAGKQDKPVGNKLATPRSATAEAKAVANTLVEAATRAASKLSGNPALGAAPPTLDAAGLAIPPAAEDDAEYERLLQSALLRYKNLSKDAPQGLYDEPAMKQRILRVEQYLKSVQERKAREQAAELAKAEQAKTAKAKAEQSKAAQDKTEAKTDAIPDSETISAEDNSADSANESALPGKNVKPIKSSKPRRSPGKKRARILVQDDSSLSQPRVSAKPVSQTKSSAPAPQQQPAGRRPALNDKEALEALAFRLELITAELRRQAESVKE